MYQKGHSLNVIGVKFNVEISDYDESLLQLVFLIGIKYNEDFSWKCRKTYQELAYLPISTLESRLKIPIPPMKVYISL